jgi:hypothetical protein
MIFTQPIAAVPTQVWLVIEPVDMRIDIDGLSQRIQHRYLFGQIALHKRCDIWKQAGSHAREAHRLWLFQLDDVSRVPKRQR